MQQQMSKEQLENQVTQFNEAFNVGDRVEVMTLKSGGDTFEDVIKHPASIMGGHTAMAWLEEKGSYDLTHVVKKV